MPLIAKNKVVFWILRTESYETIYDTCPTRKKLDQITTSNDISVWELLECEATIDKAIPIIASHE